MLEESDMKKKFGEKNKCSTSHLYLTYKHLSQWELINNPLALASALSYIYQCTKILIANFRNYSTWISFQTQYHGHMK
jgi:hypothetical protein